MAQMQYPVRRATPVARGFSRPIRVRTGLWQAHCPGCGRFSEIVDDRAHATKLAGDHNEDHHAIFIRVVAHRHAAGGEIGASIDTLA